MKPSELLRKKDWCQHSAAIDAKGCGITFRDRNAVAFCTLGAIYRCYNYYESTLVRDKLVNYLGSGISSWNDDSKRTKEEVIAALEAIGE